MISILSVLMKKLCFWIVDFLRFFWKITFIFFVLRFISQSLHNWERVVNVFSRPAAECEIITRSSAYNRQFSNEPFGRNIGSVCCVLRRRGSSFR